MALRLVNPSPTSNEHSSRVLQDTSDIRNASNLELKQILGERLNSAHAKGKSGQSGQHENEFNSSTSS